MELTQAQLTSALVIVVAAVVIALVCVCVLSFVIRKKRGTSGNQPAPAQDKAQAPVSAAASIPGRSRAVPTAGAPRIHGNDRPAR